MSAELISVLVLAAMFAIAITWSVNMGLLAFAAAFLVGTGAGLSTDELFAGFPGDIFVVLVGVTYLFALAKNNGTIDWLVRAAMRGVGGRLAVIPWIMFLVAAALTAIGAVSPAAVAIVAPVALGFALQFRIDPLLMGIMVIHGAQAGGFSPISVYGSIVNNVVDESQLAQNEVLLFLGSFVFNTAMAGIVFALYGGRELLRAPRPVLRQAGAASVGGGRPVPPLAGGSAEADPRTFSPAAATTAMGSPGRPTAHQALTLLGLVVLVVLSLAFDLDVGLVAISVATVLTLVSPKVQKQAIEQISWPVVLLICGMLTYVGVLQEIGTIEWVGNGVKEVGAPLLAALVVCYIGAIVSAFASSVGVLGATVPLAVPFLLTGDVSAVGVIVALSVASTVVDVSPFSTNGAIVLANAKEVDADVLYRRLLAYGTAVVAIAPTAAWLVFVVSGVG